jgi:hypothetical protein
MNKKELSERDISTKFINPAIQNIELELSFKENNIMNQLNILEEWKHLKKTKNEI